MVTALHDTSKELTFDEAKHIYRLKGIIVPSVTQVMQGNPFKQFEGSDG